jgi:hypothetical protein
MGNYSVSQFRELFGGMPEPGEAYIDDLDLLRDKQGCSCHDGVVCDGLGLNIRACPDCTGGDR